MSKKKKQIKNIEDHTKKESSGLHALICASTLAIPIAGIMYYHILHESKMPEIKPQVQNVEYVGQPPREDIFWLYTTPTPTSIKTPSYKKP